MESEDIKYMDFEEFRQLGLLQEVNRRFFHPLGLAVEMNVDENGKTVGFGRVWDYRDDPDGMFFGEDMIKQEKIDHVEKLRKSKLIKRSVDLFNCDLDGIQVK
jgi:hypothetical protein